MVALREHPAVAAGNDAELDPRPFRRTGRRSRALQATFPSSATPRTIPSPRPADARRHRWPRRRRRGTAHRRGASRRVRSRRRRRARSRSPRLPSRNSAPAAAACSARWRSSRRRCVIAMSGSALFRASIARYPGADDHAIDNVLHDRLDRAWRMPKRTSRQPSAARLVAREPRLVDEENARPGPCEVDRRGRSCRPGTDDENVKALHPAIVGRAASRGYNCAPRRGSRVAKGGGL